MQPGHLEPAEINAQLIIDFTDGRLEFQSQLIVSKHQGNKVDLSPEPLEVDHRLARLPLQKWKLTSAVEVGSPAADCQDGGFGQGFGNPLGSKLIEKREQLVV